MKNEEYIKKWLANSLTDEEKAYFEKTSEYQSLQKLSDSLSAFQPPEYDAEAELERLQKLRPSKKGKVVKVDFMRTFLRVAAVFIVMLGVYFYFLSDDMVTVETSVAEKTTVILPDSSVVMLNALSALTYNEDQWDNNRELKLSGEAFFKVSKGSAFVVNTTKGNVTVLGTEFNVRVREEYFEVICYEGLVQVNTAEEEMQLPANHMFKLEGNAAFKEINNFIPHLVADESAFYSVPFAEVIREIERQYNVDVEAPGVNLTKRFTGRFVHSDLQMALKSVTIPMDLTFSINEDQIILSGEAQ